MNFFRHYFDLKMPLYLVRKLEQLEYDHDKFLSWYIKFPGSIKGLRSLDKTTKNLREKHRGFSSFLVVSGYYVWIVYLFACVMIFSLNPVIAIGGIMISPFLPAGTIYSQTYAYNWIKNAKKKITRKK